MFVYSYKNFTLTITGSRTIDVCCEKCKTKFKYELVRQGSSTGSNTSRRHGHETMPENRSMVAAKAQLHKRLETERELVPCPKCYWINNEQIVGFRRTQYRAVSDIGIILAVLLWLVILFTSSVGDRRAQGSAFGVSLAIAIAVMVLLVAGSLFLQRFLRNRINPNEKFAERPVVPPGTPRAWTEEEFDKLPQRNHRFVPVDPATTPHPDWAILRVGYLELPSVCCECLAPATSTIKGPPAWSRYPARIEIPLCRECRERLRGSRRLCNLATVIAAAFVVGVTFHLFRNETFGKRFVVEFGVVLAAVSAITILPSLIVSPYQLRTVDRGRAIFRIKFRNEQFTEMVCKNARDLEDTSFIPKVIPVPPYERE